jgi:uncharacterized membrane protein
VPAALGRAYESSLHPLHAILLAGTIPLFLGVLLSDLAYASSYEVQWKNFSSWLIVGGLVFGGFAMLWAFIELFRTSQHRQKSIIYFVLVFATFIFGFLNALVHAKDAWASMPEALILSSIGAVLAVTAAGIGFYTSRAGGLE